MELFREKLNRFHLKQAPFLHFAKDRWKCLFSLSDVFWISSIPQKSLNFCILNYSELFREKLNRFQLKQVSFLYLAKGMQIFRFSLSDVSRIPSFLHLAKDRWKRRFSLSDMFRILFISQKLLNSCLLSYMVLFRGTLKGFQMKQASFLHLAKDRWKRRFSLSNLFRMPFIS